MSSGQSLMIICGLLDLLVLLFFNPLAASHVPYSRTASSHSMRSSCHLHQVPSLLRWDKLHSIHQHALFQNQNVSQMDVSLCYFPPLYPQMILSFQELGLTFTSEINQCRTHRLQYSRKYRRSYSYLQFYKTLDMSR